MASGVRCGGVAPGAAAQLTGLMPVAVVFFPGLAFASLWHTPNQCSEGAKSLIQLELYPDELRLAGITHSHQPSLLSLGRRHSGGRLKTG